MASEDCPVEHRSEKDGSEAKTKNRSGPRQGFSSTEVPGDRQPSSPSLRLDDDSQGSCTPFSHRIKQLARYLSSDTHSNGAIFPRFADLTAEIILSKALEIKRIQHSIQKAKEAREEFRTKTVYELARWMKGKKGQEVEDAKQLVAMMETLERLLKEYRWGLEEFRYIQAHATPTADRYRRFRQSYFNKLGEPAPDKDDVVDLLPEKTASDWSAKDRSEPQPEKKIILLATLVLLAVLLGLFFVKDDGKKCLAIIIVFLALSPALLMFFSETMKTHEVLTITLGFAAVLAVFLSGVTNVQNTQCCSEHLAFIKGRSDGLQATSATTSASVVKVEGTSVQIITATTVTVVQAVTVEVPVGVDTVTATTNSSSGFTTSTRPLPT